MGDIGKPIRETERPAPVRPATPDTDPVKAPPQPQPVKT